MIYVMSDIHGNMNHFKSIMQQINLAPSDTLYILGDVIDRHPDGIAILEEIMDMPNVKMLLGNHEYMMLNVLNDNMWSINKEVYLWYQNSGKVTYNAFLKLDASKQQKVLKYLKALPINIDITVADKEYKLVHASPLEWYDANYHYEYRDEVEFAVWNRILYENDSNQTIIFGHTTTNHFQNDKPMCIYKAKNIIGMDCGSGYPKEMPEGRLACLRLDDMKEYYSK